MADGSSAEAANPAADICRAAAAAYNAPLLESGSFCVILATGDGCDLIVACSPHEATLWLGQHKWSDYEWRSGDAGELEDLAETLAAVQRGEGELHFRAHQRHLVYQGGRVGHQTIALAPFTDKTLTLALPAWSRAAEDPTHGDEATAGYPGP